MSSFGFPFAGPLGANPAGFSFVTLNQRFDINPGGLIPGALDMLLDPVTLDYIDTEDGAWVESSDSRSTVLCMLELELGASPFDPHDGTRLSALRRRGDPITPEIVQADTLRALGLLVSDGVISELSVQVRDKDQDPLVDQAGRFMVALRWRDLASGSPVDTILSTGA